MFTRVTAVRCDECMDAVVEVPGGSNAVCWQQAEREGWRKFRPPKDRPWESWTHVCGRCMDYGRPYKGRPLNRLELGVRVEPVEALRSGQLFTPRRTA